MTFFACYYSPLEIRQLGLYGIVPEIMEMIMARIAKKLTPTTTRHRINCSTPDFNKIVLNPNAIIKPKMTKSCPKFPNTPFLLIYLGDIYLMQRGMSARRKPMFIPCNVLTAKKTYRLGIWIRPQIASAIKQRIRVNFLILLQIYLREALGVTHGLKNVPIVTPKGKHDTRKALTTGICVIYPNTIFKFSAPKAVMYARQYPQ